MDKLEELERKVQELEKKLNQSSNMFGRSYSQVGSSEQDFLIKTRGQVKIQWGTKFIDLIKDGKINVNSKFIYNTDEVGSRDGIYVTNGGKDVTLVSNNIPINLVGEIGTTYVSFLGEQQTNAEQKRQALVNIGLIYPDITDVNISALQNGIVYIESEKKLYTITNGTLQEFKISIPNPFTEQFVVAKGKDGKGAIVIHGIGIDNSLAFDKLFLYSDVDYNVIQSDLNLNIQAKSIRFLSGSTIVDNVLKTDSIESIRDSRGSGGFRIYVSEGDSILEIDKVIERNSDTSVVYPEEFYLSNKVIGEAGIITDGDSDDANVIGISIEFTQEHSYQIGDILLVYTIQTQETEESEIKECIGTILTVTDVQGPSSVTVTAESDDLQQLADSIIGKKVFLIKSISNQYPIRLQDNNIDIVKYDSSNLESQNVQTRLGNLSALDIKEIDEGVEKKVEGHGIYSSKAVFNNVSYDSTYNLSDDDNSSRLASTEWVRRITTNPVPSGTIIAFYGDTYPEGWILCDGNNETPNLSDLGRPSTTPGGKSLVYLMKI